MNKPNLNEEKDLESIMAKRDKIERERALSDLWTKLKSTLVTLCRPANIDYRELERQLASVAPKDRPEIIRAALGIHAMVSCIHQLNQIERTQEEHEKILDTQRAGENPGPDSL